MHQWCAWKAGATGNARGADAPVNIGRVYEYVAGTVFRVYKAKPLDGIEPAACSWGQHTVDLITRHAHGCKRTGS